MNLQRQKTRLILATAIVLILSCIVLSCFIGGIDKNQKAEATALTSSTADVITTDLLLSGYASRTDGAAFNESVLSSIFKKVTGNSSATYSTVETAAKNTTGKGTVTTMHSGRDAAQIKSGNNNKYIVLKLGGLQWTVTSLSTDESGNPILTLILTDVAPSETCGWNAWMPTDLAGTYPGQMYSTSYVRAALLNGIDADNNVVQYSTDKDHLATYRRTFSGAYKFDIFAHKNAQGSLTKYLVQPKAVPYQQSLNSLTISQSIWGQVDWLNDASKDKIAVTTIGKTTEGNTMYFKWASDYIWLSSVSETGWGTLPDITFNGLWNMTTSSTVDGLGASQKFWQRTSANHKTDVASGVIATPVYDNVSAWTDMNATGLYIRPCIHLNLKEAYNAAITTITNPSDLTPTYDGNPKDITSGSWYNASNYSSSKANVKVEYLDSSGSALSIPKPINADTYKVRLTIQNHKYGWATSGTGTGTNAGRVKEITLKINKIKLQVDFTTASPPDTPTATPKNLLSTESDLAGKILKIRYTGVDVSYDSFTAPASNAIGRYTATVEIDTSVSNNYELDKTYSQPYNIEVNGIAAPTFTVGENWKTYNGSTQHYYLSYGKEDDKAEIAVTVPDEFKSLVQYNNGEVTVTRAGEDYYLLLDLVTQDGSVQWTTGDVTQKQLPFKVKQAPIEFDVTLDGSSDISVSDGDNVEVSFDGLDSVFSGDEITVNVIATMKSASTVHRTIYSGLKIDEFTELPLKIELDTSSLAVEEWEISLELPKNIGNNSDYSIDLSNKPVNLTVVEKGGASNLRWTFSRSGVSPVVQDMSVNQDIISDVAVPYDGKEITVTARPSSGYTIDTNYLQNGFTAGYKNSKGKNADTYTTYVAVKKGNEETKIYSITWTISKAQFDLSKVKWIGDGEIEYTGSEVQMTLENLPEGLEATYGGNKSGSSVGSKGEVMVIGFALTGDAVGNYEVPSVDEWKTTWEIVPATIAIGNTSNWESKTYTNESDGYSFEYYALKSDKGNGVIKYKYYETDNLGNVMEGKDAIESLDDIEYSATAKRFFKALPEITDTDNYAFTEGVTGNNLYSPMFTVGGGASEVSVSIATDKIEYNGKPRNVKLVIEGSGATVNDFDLTYYSGDVTDDAHKLEGAPTDKGNYTVVITSKKSNVVISGKNQYTFEIISATINKSWNKDAKPYVLNLKYGQIDGIEYVIADDEGNIVAYEDLAAGNTYQIKAKIKDNMQGNYSFSDGTYETDWEVFELRAEDIANMQDPNDPNNIHYPKGDENEDPDNPPSGAPSGDASGDVTGSGDGGGAGTLDELLNKLRELPLWQLIASVISIILIIIFLSKTAGYASKSKKLAKKTEKMENASTVFAGAFLGLATTGWTAIACVLMGLAVVSLVIMIIAKNKYNKVEEEYEEKKEEYDRNKSEMMYMRMMGGNMGGMGQGMQQGGYGYQQGLGVEDIRGIVSETMTALLPGVQQLLPQQASTNDELVEKLIDQNERLMHQLAQQSTHETVVAREVAVANANDETMKSLIEGQRAIMQQLVNLSTNQSQQPQVVEKIIEKEVPVEVEKIVEKVVEVPVEVEKIVEKEVKVEVPVEVEKIVEVEKEVIKEVPVEVEKIVEVEVPVEKIVEVEVPVEVEKIVEVEKEVIKEVKVEVPVEAPPKPKKEIAPRLTLDEAYALLSKTQKKYFDGLKAYALSKDKCKEKKSTYFTVFGATTTNPILKLTIKKDTTVALLKMEDEFMKDLRRDASGDGTKVKVKETEIVVGDAQAFETAKKMIDLREDQIERYNDLLKEQRSVRSKK